MSHPALLPALAIAWLLFGLVSFPSARAGQTFVPPEDLRALMLGACKGDVLRDVANDARSRGFGSRAEIVLADDEVAFVQDRKDRIRIDGHGEFRFGAEYLFQPMTFSCEWDPTRQRLRRGRYRMGKDADVTALPPELAAAVSACKREVREALGEMAERRRYWNPTLAVRPGVRFVPGDPGLTLAGEATYKLDPVQDGEAEVDYRCVWDSDAGELIDVHTTPRDPWRREKGTVTCESRNFARRTCRAPISGAVRVRSTLSDTRCTQNVNWSWSTHEIVVWDGCRATFEFEMR